MGNRLEQLEVPVGKLERQVVVYIAGLAVERLFGLVVVGQERCIVGSISFGKRFFCLE